MDHFTDSEVSLNIILSQDGEPFIPDVGTVKYSVYDHAGVAFIKDVDVETTTTTFSIPITVSAADNLIGAGRRFERRTIVIIASRGGQPHRQVATYRLTPFLTHSVQPADVRAFIGAQAKELPDEDIDLFAAFMMVERDFTADRLTTILASGTTQELAANECIKLRAVLDVLPSMKQRVAQKETNGVIGFDRATITDFGAVEHAAQTRYYSAKLEALGLTEVAPSLILTTTDADPITG